MQSKLHNWIWRGQSADEDRVFLSLIEEEEEDDEFPVLTPDLIRRCRVSSVTKNCFRIPAVFITHEEFIALYLRRGDQGWLYRKISPPTEGGMTWRIDCETILLNDIKSICICSEYTPLPTFSIIAASCISIHWKHIPVEYWNDVDVFYAV